MANTISTPSMNLQLPIVEVEPGPQFAIDVNSAFTVVDGHNHSPGYGVPISQAGILFTGNLSYSGYSAYNILSVILNSQSAAPPTVGTIYENGNDLHYINGAGLDIQMTNNSGIVGSPGSISGISGTASVNYTTPGYFFYSATLTPANISVAAISLANILASSNTFTLSPPNPLTASYSWTLPGANPPTSGAQSLLTVSNSGVLSYTTADNATTGISGGEISVITSGLTGITGSQLANQTITATQIANNTITNAQLSNISGQASSSTGTSSNSSVGTPVNIVTVNITTTGKPVMVVLQGDGSNNLQYVGAQYPGTPSFSVAAVFTIVRNSSQLVAFPLVPNSTTGVTTIPGFSFLDNGTAGVPSTYSYTLQSYVVGSSSCIAFLNHLVLYVYEI